MDIFKIVVQILSLIGAVGLFLYGMKTMSEALQKLAGKGMRRVPGKTDETWSSEINGAEIKIKNIFNTLKTTYLAEDKDIGIPFQTGLYFNELPGLTEKMSNFVFATNNVFSALQTIELKNRKSKKSN